MLRSIIKVILFLPVMFMIMCVPLAVSPTLANWVDSWVSSVNQQPVKSFNGATRGYVTGGGFSYRTQMGNDYLVTASPPKVGLGCGGVDLAFGSFGYLNPDKLMKKLQNILSAAPSLAFDLALKATCPQCSETMKAMENFIQALNGMSINDCQASKAMVATIAGGLIPDMNMPKDYAVAQASFMSNSGLSNMWDSAKEIYTSATTKKETSAVADVKAARKEMSKNCPSTLTALFGTNGWVIKAAAEARGLPSDFIPVVQAMIGDMYVYWDDEGQYHKKAVAACQFDWAEMQEGRFPTVTISGDKENAQMKCGTMSSASLNDTIIAGLQEISDSLTNSTKLPPGSKGNYLYNFAAQSGMNIGALMRASVAQGRSSETIANITPYMTSMLLYSMLMDATRLVIETRSTVANILSAQKTGGEGCDSTPFVEMAGELNNLILGDPLYWALDKIGKDYGNKMKDLQAITDVVSRWEKAGASLYMEVGRSFSNKSLAARAVFGGNR